MKQTIKKAWARLFGRKFDGTTEKRPKAILVNGDIISKVEITSYPGDGEIWFFRRTKNIEELKEQFDVVAYIDGDLRSDGHIIASGVNMVAFGDVMIEP